MTACAFACVAALCSCRDSGPVEKAPVRKEPGLIAFIGAGRDDPLWPLLRAGAQRFEREYGRIEVRYDAPAIVSAEQQARLIQSLIHSSLRGLCVQVVAGAPLEPVFARVVQSGGQIITMCRRTDLPNVAGHVGYDDEAAGRALAEETVRYLNGQGTIMLLHEGQRDPAMRVRFRAFEEAIRRHPRVERLADTDCGGDPLLARRQIADFFARYPRLSAWVSLAPWPLLEGATERAGASALPAGCRLIPCGAEPATWPYIESGACPVAVGFAYHDAGFTALQFCQAAARSPGSGAREYTIPIRVVTPASLEEYRRDWAVWAAAPTSAPTAAP